MSLFYVTRPAPEPDGWDSQRGCPKHTFTRYGRMQFKRERAVKMAQRVGGRAYEYDGEHRLIHDAHKPSRDIREHAQELRERALL